MQFSVNIGLDFSRYPAGRFPTDGKYNGETFRKKFLTDSLNGDDSVDIYFDDAIHYGSSFLEEAFGGLIRIEHFSKLKVLSNLKLHSEDDMLIEEIKQYIEDAEPE